MAKLSLNQKNFTLSKNILFSKLITLEMYENL